MQHTLFTHQENGNSEMLSPLKSTLLNLYPERDGWKLYNRYNWATKVFDFVLQKEEGLQTSRILVEINFERVISKEHFNKLDVLAKRLKGGNCVLVRKIMIVDDMSSIASIPEDVDIVPISTLIRTNLLPLQNFQPRLVA
ncbi:MAG: hypothetical protein ACKVPJ_02170 [Chitinophagales bacterium]